MFIQYNKSLGEMDLAYMLLVLDKITLKTRKYYVKV